MYSNYSATGPQLWFPRVQQFKLNIEHYIVLLLFCTGRTALWGEGMVNVLQLFPNLKNHMQFIDKPKSWKHINTKPVDYDPNVMKGTCFILKYHWQIQGVLSVSPPPTKVTILSFSHTNFMKRSHTGLDVPLRLAPPKGNPVPAIDYFKHQSNDA